MTRNEIDVYPGHCRIPGCMWDHNDEWGRPVGDRPATREYSCCETLAGEIPMRCEGDLEVMPVKAEVETIWRDAAEPEVRHFVTLTWGNHCPFRFELDDVPDLIAALVRAMRVYAPQEGSR
jgi:hypothetical protein